MGYRVILGIWAALTMFLGLTNFPVPSPTMILLSPILIFGGFALLYRLVRAREAYLEGLWATSGAQNGSDGPRTPEDELIMSERPTAVVVAEVIEEE